MLTTEEYTRLDAIAMADLRRRGQVSASELLECAFAQSDRLNPQLNAIVHQDRDNARQQARQIDQRAGVQPDSAKHGPLSGVPFLIKEVNAVAGWPHTRSTRLYRHQVASSDSAIMRRYRQAGLIAFGSTNTPELCLTISTEFSLFGSSRNPHNLKLSSCRGRRHRSGGRWQRRRRLDSNTGCLLRPGRAKTQSRSDGHRTRLGQRLERHECRSCLESFSP